MLSIYVLAIYIIKIIFSTTFAIFFKDFVLLCHQISIAKIAQLVEHQLPKLRVAGPNPVFRSSKIKAFRFSESLFFAMCLQMRLQKLNFYWYTKLNLMDN